MFFCENISHNMNVFGKVTYVAAYVYWLCETLCDYSRYVRGKLAQSIECFIKGPTLWHGLGSCFRLVEP